jgi:hypothetical protein
VQQSHSTSSGGTDQLLRAEERRIRTFTRQMVTTVIPATGWYVVWNTGGYYFRWRVVAFALRCNEFGEPEWLQPLVDSGSCSGPPLGLTFMGNGTSDPSEWSLRRDGDCLCSCGGSPWVDHQDPLFCERCGGEVLPSQRGRR